MNNDTVNPIPPSRETPAIFFQFIPKGIGVRPLLTASQVKE